MKRIVAASIAIIASNFGCHSVTQGAPPAVTVAVQGVRVAKPPPEGDEMLRAFNTFPGTTVALAVTEPRGGLVVFDIDASRVKSLVDDKGKDLTKSDPGTKTEVPENWVFTPGWLVSKDRKHCSLEVTVPGTPSRGATTLALSGTLVFKCATEKKDFTTQNVSLHAGALVSAGAIPLTIKSAGKPRFGGDDKSTEIEFHAKQTLDAIIRMKFFDATGNRIEAEEAGRGVETTPDGGSAPAIQDATICYRLKDAGNMAKIVVTCWTDIGAVAIPLDLKVGLGL